MHDPNTYRLVKWAVILSNLGVLCSIAAAESREDRLGATVKAVWMVESGGQLHPPDGDNGASWGPMQLQMAAVEDVNRYWRKHYTSNDRRDPLRAIEISVAYWLMYAPDGDPQTWARIHNGGPRGHLRTSTLQYWLKCKKYLDSTP